MMKFLNLRKFLIVMVLAVLLGGVTPPNVPVLGPRSVAAAVPSYELKGNRLKPGAVMVSANGRYQLKMQTDGNLVLRTVPDYKAIWSSGTSGNKGAFANMQSDGNFVIYTKANKPLWHTRTNGRHGAKLVLQNDGNLVIYQGETAVWSTVTARKHGPVVVNGSFEGGTRYWKVLRPSGAKVNLVTKESKAKSGLRYAATNATNGGSIYQDITFSTSSTKGVTTTVWVRAEGNGDASGRFCTYARGKSTHEFECVSYTVGSSWKKLATTVKPDRSHTSIRVQLYPKTGTTHLDLVQAKSISVKKPMTSGTVPSRLKNGERLASGKKLVSPNGKYQVAMQSDGNLVLSEAATNRVVWASGTAGNAGAFANMQNDGNFVVYTKANKPLWSTRTDGSAGAFVQIQDDGNFVVYANTNKPLWATLWEVVKPTTPAGNSGGSGTAGGGETTSPSSSTFASRARDLRSKIGEPINEPHRWGPVAIQDFRGGEWGESALIQGQFSSEVYVVRSGFWEAYKVLSPEEVGRPVEDETTVGDVSYQRFENGTLRWIKGHAVWAPDASIAPGERVDPIDDILWRLQSLERFETLNSPVIRTDNDQIYKFAQTGAILDTKLEVLSEWGEFVPMGNKSVYYDVYGNVAFGILASRLGYGRNFAQYGAIVKGGGLSTPDFISIEIGFNLNGLVNGDFTRLTRSDVERALVDNQGAYAKDTKDPPQRVIDR